MRLLSLALLFLLSGSAAGQDVIEFLSGAKIEGTVTSIDQTAKKVSFESKIGTRTSARVYEYAKIHAVTYRGKRYVLTPKPEGTTTTGGTSSATPSGSATRRTKAEIDKLIDEVGRAAPDWLEPTTLNLPNTLDLDWPLNPPDKGWNNQKNVGQFFWDVINPNPNRWKEGVKLVHVIMARHQGNAALLSRDWKKLAETYFELFQDYPRAAFWLRQARVAKTDPQNVTLAECYWRLGNKQMALDQLNSPTVTMNAIKLYGDLGETKKALELANQAAKGQPQSAQYAYLLAGDACRVAGQFDEAISYYTKALNVAGDKSKDYVQRNTARARESIEAIKLFDQADVGQVADGTYRASSTGYSGAVDVEVKVGGGKIEAVRVTNHVEKQFYSALTDTPNQIIEKQTVKGIDATSRATITSQAIINASAKALAQGAK